MLSPGFPPEMPWFARALAAVGARVHGVGDQPREGLADDVRGALSTYLQVRNLWDEEAVVAAVRQSLGGRTVDRVECLWEPGMVLAGRLREALEVPGPGVHASRVLRDKELMKATLDAAGIRTPHHYRCSAGDEVRAALEKVGYPAIVKPIDGAGSADTYRLEGPEDIERALALVKHVPQVLVEEFVVGEEHTYDTVSGAGRILFENVAWYRPTPLVARLNEWISAQAICLREIDRPEIDVGVQLGRRVLEALEFRSGFAHLEWVRTPAGEAIFGEIGGRPPGGRLVHVMNFSCDCDLVVGWAEAVCWGRISQDLTKKYNAAVIFKRAVGGGRTIRRIDGLEKLRHELGEHIAAIELTLPGRPRVDWRQVVSGDGWVVVRHPELATTLAMADRVGSELVLRAD